MIRNHHLMRTCEWSQSTPSSHSYLEKILKSNTPNGRCTARSVDASTPIWVRYLFGFVFLKIYYTNEVTGSFFSFLALTPWIGLKILLINFKLSFTSKIVKSEIFLGLNIALKIAFLAIFGPLNL